LKKQYINIVVTTFLHLALVAESAAVLPTIWKSMTSIVLLYFGALAKIYSFYCLSSWNNF